MNDSQLELIRTLVVAVVAIVSPLIIAAVKKGLTSLPKWLTPILTPVVGVLLTGVAQALGLPFDTSTTVAVGVAGGLAGTGVREIVDQTKKVNA